MATGYSFKEGFEALKEAPGELLKGATAMGEQAAHLGKKAAIGTGAVAGGAAGGAVGLAGRIAGTAMGVAGTAASAVGKFAQNYKTLALVVTAVAAYKGIKSWFKNRNRTNALEEMRSANDLVEARLANADMQAAGAGVGPDPSINYRNDWAARQQQGAAHTAGRSA